jgi:hypothetical protein
MNVARTIVYEQRKFFGEPLDISPHDALILEVQRSAGIVAFLERHLQDLSENGEPTSAILAQGTKLGVVPSVWMQLFIEERKHLVSVSATAIKAGVAERKVKIAEQQAQLIALMLMNLIHDPELGLTPEQLMKAPLVARTHLLRLNSEAMTGQETPFEDVIDAKVIDP